MSDKSEQSKQAFIKFFRDKQTDDEEPYWFMRWVAMRNERNKLREEVETYRNLDTTKVYKENQQLKNTLTQIKTQYQLLKDKIHNGHNKNFKKK